MQARTAHTAQSIGTGAQPRARMGTGGAPGCVGQGMGTGTLRQYGHISVQCSENPSGKEGGERGQGTGMSVAHGAGGAVGSEQANARQRQALELAPRAQNS